jgi:hypothetical protein
MNNIVAFLESNTNYSSLDPDCASDLERIKLFRALLKSLSSIDQESLVRLSLLTKRTPSVTNSQYSMF